MFVLFRQLLVLTDSEPEISEDDDPNFINHDLDWVSVFGNGKILNCIFLAIFNRLFLLLCESNTEFED